MAGPVALHRYRFADYLALEEASNTKHEFLSGEIYAMACGTPEHAALAAPRRHRSAPAWRDESPDRWSISAIWPCRELQHGVVARPRRRLQSRRQIRRWPSPSSKHWPLSPL